MRNLTSVRALRAVAAAVLVAAASGVARAQDDPTGFWSPEASAQHQNFVQGGSASDGAYLYVVGGDQTNNGLGFPDSFRRLRRYDPVTNTWEDLSQFPFPVIGNAVAYHSGRLFSFGGVNFFDTTSAAIVSYSIATPGGGWTTLSATLSEARFDLAAASLGDRIHIVGGAAPVSTTTHDEFDPATDTRTIRQPLPQGRQGLTLTASPANGLLYAVGGSNGGSFTSSTYEYDPATNAWTSRTDAPQVHRFAASFELQGRVYVTGGIGGGGALNTNYEFNPATNSWASRAFLAVARSNHASGAIAGRGYVYGGQGTGAPITGAEYTPPVFPPPPPDNQAPTADAGPDQTVEATGPDGASVTLDGSASSDLDEDDLTYAWSPGNLTGVNPTVTLPIGEHVITLTVSDGQETSTDTVVITVVDTTGPVVSDLTPSPRVLWSPNHDMRPIVLTFTAADEGDPAPDCEIISVSSNQPTGNEEDWVITGAMTLNLRAERTNGESRVYTITVRCTDASGNSSLEETTVCVPHNQGSDSGAEAKKAKK